MDANSIYTNIDPEEGVDDCYRKLETHTQKKTVSSNTLKNFILSILKSNVFRFCNTVHIQNKRTEMGTSIAANHANLSMAMF